MKLKRWQYLLTSTALITLVMAVGTGTYLTLVRQEKIEEMREAQDENEALTQQIDIYREQIRIMDERLVELETMLLNLERVQRIVNGAGSEASPLSPLSSQGGRGGYTADYTATTMPATMPSGFSAGKFERAFKGTGLEGIGEALVAAEAEHGINALLLAGVIVHETGWGTSRLARERNNLAGLGAYDCSPGKAIRFGSREECIMFLAELLRDKPGDNLREIGIWYASDPAWAAKVAGCMKMIAEAGQDHPC